MKILLILLSAVILIGIICFFIANYLVHFVLDRKMEHKEGLESLSTDPDELAYAVTVIGGSKEWKEFFYKNAEERTVNAFDGTELFGYFLKADSHKYAILCHGYTSDLSGMLGKAEHLYKDNFNILAVDARAHGKSGGRFRGMGWLERLDIKLWAEEIIKSDPQSKIILFGQSMGAATVLNTVGEEDLAENVRLAISDCAYLGVWEEFSLQLKVRYHLPAFPIMHIADIISRKKAGYTFSEASPLSQIKKCKIPVLFIHGEDDDFVPFSFLDELYNAANVPKEKMSVKGARHCMSEVIENERYWKTIDNFIEKYL
ncbi:MAG: alpha/beta hydrolase [Anaerofustis stercorihominis]|nr:alpha/beta hydrolase [Anaerofustis stercorihominis]